MTPTLDAAVHAALGREYVTPSGVCSKCGFTIAIHRLSERTTEECTMLRDYSVSPSYVPRYSTDANAALEAYEEIRKRGWRIFTIADILSPAEEWRISLKRYFNTERQAVQGEGSSFASALCAAIVEAGKR